MLPRRFRFCGDLRRFLPPALRSLDEFEHSAPEPDSLKHVIESLGVPHTEFGRVVIENDLVTVYPSEIEPDPAVRFLLDVHLGRLAAYLRMAGFDAEWPREAPDEKLAALSRSADRVLLTRDTGLLKRNEVSRGYFVRATEPREQMTEVVHRFGLGGSLRPFTRCLRCNMLLAELPAPDGRVPPRARELHTAFRECPQCRRVFWRGSHYARMAEWLERLRLL